MSNHTKPVLPEPDLVWVTKDWAGCVVSTTKAHTLMSVAAYGAAMFQYGREQMREECIVAVEGEHLPSYGKPESQRSSDDFAYDTAIQDAANAIRKLP